MCANVCGAARLLSVCCLLLLHTPDGSTIAIRSESITAVRPAPAAPHVTAGARSIVFMGGAGSGAFAIAEDAATVLRQIRECR